MNKKEFSNPELKQLIINLHDENNLTMDDNLKKLLSKSSRIQYKSLYSIYTNTKNTLTEKLINNKSSSNSSDCDNEILTHEPIIIIKEIEIQNITKQIDEDLNDEIKKLKTELFNNKQLLANYKYKNLNYKKLIKELIKKNTNINEDNISSNDDEIEDTNNEKRKIKYSKLVELSSFNLSQELLKLSKHELKVLYNRYFSSKLKRHFNT